MESARIARCSYGAVTVVIALFEHSKYADICNEMCLRFKELKIGTFELTYSLPEHPNCLLQSDMDVHLMLMCLSMLKSSFVDISVKDLLSSNNKDGNHATFNHAAPNHTPYSHAVSNHAAPDHAASNDATSDHAAVIMERLIMQRLELLIMHSSNDVISNRAASNDAISNHATCGDAIYNHAASSSCMLDSGAFDGNEHLRTSRFHEGETLLSQGWKEYINNVGQKFEGGVAEFRNKLCKYAFATGFRFAFVKKKKNMLLLNVLRRSQMDVIGVYMLQCVS
ncbi:PREDICTED: LOC109949009 [Prunus dulcis]|uniref:PREDICTED: LOC109949009 n=1 Tax=Prunus dulcis TaxID=3755 RepID=A0A5E4G8Y8_PRUDU|nr:PREDICTED: LOC109949009 [Prunus dulcis]